LNLGPEQLPESPVFGMMISRRFDGLLCESVAERRTLEKQRFIKLAIQNGTLPVNYSVEKKSG
jgi:hypothetical protein